MQIDLRVLELLSSKICHDLISPVSAINNGVELIEDIGGSVVDEAMQLIGNSAGLAARRLKMFRIAYGRAGSEENVPLKDVRQIIEGYFQDSKITFHLPDQAVSEALLARQGSLKCLINLAILSEELLPYGGAITGTAGGDGRCTLRVVGKGAQLSPAQQGALGGELPVVDLTPRTIQPYITGRYVEHFGLTLSWHELPEEVDL
ncbi:MAG: hypothetical protein EBV03_13480, partial [Proteobacteria bacterium]|nr:hypothetical protein [Pseudomonadota bacterium]